MTTAASQYKTAAQDTSRNVGSVTGRPVTTFLIDIEARVPGYAVGQADEIVLRLNGRPLKRMTRHQAIRAGVIAEGDQ